MNSSSQLILDLIVGFNIPSGDTQAVLDVVGLQIRFPVQIMSLC